MTEDKDKDKVISNINFNLVEKKEEEYRPRNSAEKLEELLEFEVNRNIALFNYSDSIKEERWQYSRMLSYIVSKTVLLIKTVRDLGLNDQIKIENFDDFEAILLMYSKTGIFKDSRIEKLLALENENEMLHTNIEIIEAKNRKLHTELTISQDSTESIIRNLKSSKR